MAQRLAGWLLAREVSNRGGGHQVAECGRGKWETGQQLVARGSNSITTTGKAVSRREGAHGQESGPIQPPSHSPGVEEACEMVPN